MLSCHGTAESVIVFHKIPPEEKLKDFSPENTGAETKQAAAWDQAAARVKILA
jgi:hypothetical protein